MRPITNEYAERIPTAYLRCRTYGHGWRAHTAQKIKGGYRVVVACECGTMRMDEMDRSGYVVKRSYEYPFDYHVVGYGRATADARAALRIRNVLTSFEQPRRRRAS